MTESGGSAIAVRVLTAVFVVVGLAARLTVTLLPVGAIDSDNAIVGLMAFHPGELPVFYWGQAYGGSLESALAAALFAVLPDTAFVLKLVPISLSVVAAYLVWRIGLRCVGAPAARLGALAFLVWPAAFLWWSTKAGTYWGALCCALASVLLLLQLVAERRWTVKSSMLFGLSVGIGFWLNTQTLYLVAPASIVAAPLAVRNWRRLPLVAGAAIAGAIPWIAYNLRNDFESLEVPPHPVTTYTDRLEVFIDHLLPQALGLQVPFTRRWLPLGQAATLVVVVVLVGGCAWLWMRHPRARPLAAVVLVYPFLYALSPLSWYADQPRYLLFLMPALSLVGAAVLTAPRRIPFVAPFALLAGLVLLDVPAIRDMNDRRTPSPYAPDVLVPVDLSDLKSLLRDEGIKYAFADYWLSYRTTFETGEVAVVSPYNGMVRRAEYDRAVRAADAPAYLFVAASRTDEAFTDLLEGQGILVERRERGEFAVLVPSRKVLPEQVGAALEA